MNRKTIWTLFTMLLLAVHSTFASDFPDLFTRAQDHKYEQLSLRGGYSPGGLQIKRPEQSSSRCSLKRSISNPAPDSNSRDVSQSRQGVKKDKVLSSLSQTLCLVLFLKYVVGLAGRSSCSSGSHLGSSR
jgi:hypothetical protein